MMRALRSITPLVLALHVVVLWSIDSIEAFVAYPLPGMSNELHRRPGVGAKGVKLSTRTTIPTSKMTSETDTESSFSEKIVSAWKANVMPRNPDDFPPCPSGVSAMSKPIQAAVFISVFLGIAAGTLGILSGFSNIEASLPTGWFSAWKYSWPIGLGPIFMAAGVSHFTLHEDFCRVYPGKGAWGFWYLPGSASFHVNWTGVAELVGGLGLALGGFGLGPSGLLETSALGLFGLTLAITPANIFMFTHGAQLPEGLEVPVVGHFIRGVFQCLLLAFFWRLANPL